MNEIKIWIGAVITILVLFFYAAIVSDYDIDTYTGNNIGPVQTHETQLVEIESDGSFNLTLASCSPFSIKVDGEVELSGHPENISGTECSNSYYKYQETVHMSSLEVTEGDPKLSISSEIPAGISVAYPEDTRKDVTETTGIAAFWIWFILIIIVFGL